VRYINQNHRVARLFPFIVPIALQLDDTFSQHVEVVQTNKTKKRSRKSIRTMWRYEFLKPTFEMHKYGMMNVVVKYWMFGTSARDVRSN